MSEFFNGKKLNKSINPDEAVAHGAAVQAASLTGNFSDAPVLVDVAPLSLGIETAGGVMTNLIDRNSRVPCRKTNTFTTFQDNQPAVSIQVYEGERKFTKDNNLLGRFDLTGIAPRPRGIPQIEVAFNLDSDSILAVTAVDKENNSITKTIEIKPEKGRLSKDDIERIIKEAAKFEAEDALKKEKIDARNGLENMLYQTKNQFGEKVPQVNEYIDQQLLWVEDNSEASTEELKAKTKEVQDKIQQIVSAAQQQQAPQQHPSQPDVDEID